jgi:small subunit ribosomal protein S7
MPRRAKVERRIPAPDARYQSEVLARFINKVMERGKKGTAERIVYGALDRIGDRTGRAPLEVFEQALGNATPVIEVKPRRVGGATYQVPVEIRGDRRLSLGVRWLVQAARRRSGKSMSEKLASEFVDAMNGLGAAVKRREDTHKMAEANRAFSHFKW